MRPEEDAFGQALWAFHNGKSGYEIYETDDGDLEVIEIGAYFATYDDWPQFEKDALERVKGRVLDVGCGAGRHSLYLQGKGFDVLGIDISPLAIEVCKLRGLHKAEVMSIDDINYKPNSFDTIIMMGNNFCLLGSFERARSILKIFYDMASEEAIIIAASCDLHMNTEPEILKYIELNKKRGRMGGQFRTRVRFKRYATAWFDYLFTSKGEMEEILEGTGWKASKYMDSGGANYIAIIDKDKGYHSSPKRGI